MSQTPRYVLITPAWNEAQFLELTIASVVQQTVTPVRWVIVDDGSTDATPDIVRKYAAEHEWIRLVTIPRRAQRDFARKAAAFREGQAHLTGLEYDVIGNLDADVSFDPDYLEFLLQKFADNPRLGVTGTPYKENDALHDDRFKSPDHVSGACQLFRRECFDAIGGYPLVRTGGIDLIALLAAQAKGWQTRRYDERFCIHHRSVGSGQISGLYRRLFNHGRKDYLLGSHPAFELFRAVYQMKRRPYVVGGLLMLSGYVWTALGKSERSMGPELVEIRQRDQIQRLKQVLLHPHRHTSRAAASARS